MAPRSSSHDRYSFANLQDHLELPDLIAVQRESFEWFMSHGLKETFEDISPITDYSGDLRLDLEFDPNDEDLCPGPKFTEEECREKEMTFATPVLCAPFSLTVKPVKLKNKLCSWVISPR